MNRTLLLLVALVVAAAALAWRVGGALGAGIAAGALCGGSLAALGASWQQHVIRTRPERALAALVEVFLVKIACLLGSALTFRFVPQAAERVDWRSFLLGFATCAFAVMIAGTFDTARALKLARRSAGTGSGRLAEPTLENGPVLGEGRSL